jgi:predicted nucleic acid-binding protein
MVGVDSSVMIKLVGKEADSQLADELWESWLAEGLCPIAPASTMMDACSVIWNKTYRRHISHEADEASLATLLTLSVNAVMSDDLYLRA